jgi:hypothetical protein
MNEDQLKELLHQEYKTENWKKITEFVFPNVSYFQKPQQIPIKGKFEGIAESFNLLGFVRLQDGKNLAIFEIKVADRVSLSSNRVQLRELVSEHINQDSNHGVLAIYEQGKEDYRFTFSAKSTAFDEEENDFVNIETDAKRFTYILGKNESCRTAASRFWELSTHKETATIQDVENAFSVERLNKEFFSKYKVYYEDFVQYITGKRYEKEKSKWVEKTITNPNPLHKTVFNSDDKLARNFVKLLLGRLVFIQFLQKKGWLGVPASNDIWADGEKDFLLNLYTRTKDKDQFHSLSLYPLFYRAFNTPNRPNDIFKLTGTRVPYLNGGLFENEYANSEDINFPAAYFENLLNFFGQYNFTVDENDALDHEVGIDPEMLGHIFENLLEDNKDKGAFYTPKPIVQYMCQESLIQYLKNYLQLQKKWPLDDSTAYYIENNIQNFVRKKIAGELINDFDEHLAKALKDVKICDPAIGSGAFPMGLLNEIFYCMNVLYKASPDVVGEIWEMDTWAPDVVKKNIIQNSIYGVDIEKGAVDIARLRFWLCLIVDEKVPTPLPNLDFKIMQGNSLLESYEGIDLSKIAGKKTSITENEVDLFGNPINMPTSIFDTKYIDNSNITDLIDSYFNTQLPNQKQELKQEIDTIIHNHIDYNLEFEENKILIAITNLKNSLDLVKVNRAHSKGIADKTTKAREKVTKDLECAQKKLDNFITKRKILHDLQKTTERPYFLWHLYFRDVFENGGFDIVIGNPPYGTSIKGDYRKYLERFKGKVPDYEIYYYFNELALEKVQSNGVLAYIIPNTFLFNVYASEYRKILLNNWDILCILDCTRFKIFTEATVFNCINIFKKADEKLSNIVGYKPTGMSSNFNHLISQQTTFVEKEILLKNNQNWGLVFKLDSKIINIVNSIRESSQKLDEVYPEFSQGLIAYDKYQGQKKEIIESRAYHYKTKMKPSLKNWLWGEDVTRFQVKWNNKEYIDYCSGIANPRDPKFFTGPRVLVREITNPAIFAAFTEKELYHDPAIIVIKESKKLSLLFLVGMLNSKLASFYHFNSSPKATKGGFPKILVEDIRNFPIPKDINSQIIEVIIDKVKSIITSKELGQETAAIEKVVDELMYKLYKLSYKDVLLIDPLFGISEKEYLK